MTPHSSVPRSFLDVVLSLTLTTLVLPVSAAAQELSRAQAVALALAANPEVKLSLEQVAMREGQIREARAAGLPDVSWLTRAGRSRDPGLLNSPNFDQFPPEFRGALQPIATNLFDTYAEVQQTIFSFQIGAAIQAARLARNATQEEVRRARQATALEAVQAYNQLLFALAQLEVARSTIDQKQGHLDTARNRRAAGAATELEVLRAEVDLENQRAELYRSETQVTAARSRLNTVMLRPTETPIQPTDELLAITPDMTFDQALEEALVARPELQALRIEAETRDRLIDVVRADMKPRVEFDGLWGVSVRNPDNLFNLNFRRWSGIVTLTVPVFDGHRTDGRVAQRQADRNIVTQQITALENRIRLDVQSAWDVLALADRTLKAADLNVTQARRAAEMTDANYKLGAATPLDVLDAQEALAQAENTRNLALFTHANARASLSFVTGRDPLTNVPSVAP
jgi:HAE1 family hydrophobic/amphiphilic exporter-1